MFGSGTARPVASSGLGGGASGSFATLAGPRSTVGWGAGLTGTYVRVKGSGASRLLRRVSTSVSCPLAPAGGHFVRMWELGISRQVRNVAAPRCWSGCPPWPGPLPCPYCQEAGPLGGGRSASRLSSSFMGILRPRQKPKKAYPNSDRFAEDGQRLYSAYAPAAARKAARRRYARTGSAGLIAAAIVLAAIWWFV